MGIGRGLGIIGAALWHRLSLSNRAAVDSLNAEAQQKKAKKRKEFEKWLAAQPFDDEPRTA